MQTRPRLMVNLAKFGTSCSTWTARFIWASTLFPQTRPFLAMLNRLGIGSTFITNNCSRSRSEYFARLRAMGIDVEPDAISTSAQATAHYLLSSLPDVRRLFVLGTAGLQADLQAAGFEIVTDRPDAVVVGFDPELTYDRTRAHGLLDLAIAAVHRHASRPRLPNRPTDCPPRLRRDSARCSNRRLAAGPMPYPENPAPRCCKPFSSGMACAPHETALVGDRLYTDIRMARDAGAVAILTLTGETKRAGRFVPGFRPAGSCRRRPRRARPVARGRRDGMTNPLRPLRRILLLRPRRHRAGCPRKSSDSIRGFAGAPWKPRSSATRCSTWCGTTSTSSRWKCKVRSATARQ